MSLSVDFYPYCSAVLKFRHIYMIVYFYSVTHQFLRTLKILTQKLKLVPNWDLPLDKYHFLSFHSFLVWMNKSKYKYIRRNCPWVRAGTVPDRTGISPVETFKKYPLLTLFFAIKTKMSHIFLIEFVKKCSKTHVILIICSKVLCKKDWLCWVSFTCAPKLSHILVHFF
jgi:hypothetical protein